MELPDFSAHFARVTRAEKRGSDLASAIQAWSGVGLRGEAAIADDRLSWELRLRIGEPPPVDTDWNFTFVEAVNHLRASLDNAAITLAQHGGVTDPKRLKRVSFPIASTSQEWTDNKDRVQDLPPNYRTAIEAVQPFQHGSAAAVANDGLLFLSRFDNHSKHYLQIGVVLQPIELRHTGSIEFETEEGAAATVPPDVEIFGPVFHDGELLLRQRTKGRIAKVNGGYGLNVEVQAVHPGGRQFGVTKMLAGLCVYTRQVLILLQQADQLQAPPT